MKTIMRFDDIKIEDIKNIALKAGDVIMEIYKEDFEVEFKADNSPLTKADKLSNELICSSLEKLYPQIPIMSEENKQVEYEERKNWEYYWCIDPIDGTKEFIKKNGEFTVNIALIYKNKPVLGVVYAPAIEDLYWAKENEGAFKNNKKLPFTKNSDENFTVVASKSHLSKETQEFIDELAKRYPLLTTNSKGSSLKLCMVAEGIADIYPRMAPTMEWDTAAADAIVRIAGKMTYQYEKNIPLMYNKENLLNPWFIVK
ncbi:3'(2'),5'-bisphosphate nucleotidase CysQ [Campylobacterota bacterium DY0563]